MTTTGRPRICILTNEYPPLVWGGIGTTVHGLCTTLAKRGIVQLEVITRNRSAEPDQSYIFNIEHFEGVRVHRLISGELTLARLRDSIDISEFDLLHVHGAHFINLSIAWRDYSDISLIFSMHSNARTEARYDQKFLASDIPLQDKIVDLADCIFVQSRYAEKEFFCNYPNTNTKVAVVANGIHKTIEEASQDILLEPPSKFPVCLYCGRFHPRKGLDVLLKAVPLVHLQIPEAKFVFIGGHSSEFAENYHKDIRLLSLNDPRIVALDWQPIEFLINWYRKADIVIVPSLYEPFGNVAIEALAMGKPVVASRTGGLLEIVEAGKNGVLVTPGDAESLAAGIVEVLSDEQRYLTYARYAISKTKPRYLWENLAVEYELCYRNVLQLR